MNDELMKAREAGDYLGDNYHLSNNIVQANVHTKDSIRTALNTLRSNIGKWIQANEGEEAFQEFMQWSRRFDGAADEFRRVTGENRRIMNQASNLTERIKRVSDDEFPELVRKAFTDLDIPADVPENKGKAISIIWDTLLDRQKTVFQAARESASNQFYQHIDDARRFVPDQWYDAYIKKSKDILGAHLNIKEARKLDEAIMINGKMKPISDYVRALMQIDDTENAVRGLSSFYNYTPSLQPNDTFFDNAILDTLRKFNPDIEADNLGDIKLEQAVEGFEAWRNSKGLQRKLGTIEDLVGPKPSSVLPDGVKEIDDLVRSFRKGTPLVPSDAGKLLRFMGENANADETARLQEIMTAARQEGGDVLSNIIDRSNRIVDLVEETMGRVVDDLPEEALERADDYADNPERFLDEIVESVIPPYGGGTPTEPRHIHEMRDVIDATFENIKKGVRQNWGKKEYIGVTDELTSKLDDYFERATRHVSQARVAASGYADEMRKFVLHDYPDRRGADMLLSNLFNFHFWPSRTAAKWIGTRLWTNPGLVADYIHFRQGMERQHATYPDWWKYAINTNELLGLDMDNPIFFRIENLVNPIYDLTSADFQDDRKRVNWWTAAIDDINKNIPGYLNPAFTYTIAAALRAQGEEEAAERWAGRLLPATNLVTSLTSLIGAREGRGIEIDPSVQIFSGGIGPHRRGRIARALAAMLKEGKYTEEQIIDVARTRSGPAWEEAVARQMRKDATGTLVSNFIGINSRQRSMDDLTIDQFWADYSRLWALSGNMDSNEFRYNMEKMRDAYPFMDTLLLSRKGDKERDSAYAYAVLSRVKPGKTDNLSAELGLPYDMINKFYESKGDFSDWPEGDRKRFMGVIADLGASLALPNDATRKEWLAASTRYSEMRDQAKEIFGDDIWTKVDAAYAQKGAGINSNVQFEKYLENNPDVEQAMEWRTRYILQDPVLSAYYGGLDKLRSYYMGQMYDSIEKELGEDIWDKWTTYWSLRNTGQDDRAKAFFNDHPELEEYGDLKEEGLKQIQEQIVKYGNDLPEGEDMRLREDFTGESIGQAQAQEFVEGPQPRRFTTSEWVEMIGAEETRMAILAYEGQVLPNDIREYLEDIATQMDMTYDELLISVGESQ